MRDFYLILNSLVALALIILSLVAFLSNKKALANRLFLLFSSAVAVWLVSAAFSNDVRLSPEVAIVAKYLVFLCSYFASYFILVFVAVVIDSKSMIRRLRVLSIPIVLIGLISASPLVVRGIAEKDGVYAVDFGPVAVLYATSLVAILIASLVILHVGGRHARGKKRIQVRYLYISLLISIPILVATQFIVPFYTGFFEVTDTGILIMILPVAALYLIVIKHGLFDVKAAVLRGVTYGLVLASLALVYYLLAYGVSVFIFGGSIDTGVSVSPMNIALALVLAFLFQPFKRFFDKLTNRLFYKDMYSTADFYEYLNTVVRMSMSLRRLMSKSSDLIKDTLKAEFASFYVYKSSGSVITEGSGAFRKMPAADIRGFDELRTPVNVNDPGLSVPIRRLMTSHRIAIAVPLYREGESVGLLCLGDRKTSHFSGRDIRVLRVAAGELVIGIQNALSVQEIRDLNDNLQQRIDAATKELRRSNSQLQKLDETKDEFISMASHQLRTPLTSIKGYLSMMIDGDLGKVTPQQRQVLEEAFTSSERMVHLISDFLNVSRLQTGRFVIDKSATDLASLVGAEVSSLRQNAASRDLVLDYDEPKNLPLLDLDADKFKQVVMNFIDNAIYYSKSGTSIKITLKKTAGCVEFKVKDTGIGVPESEQSGLFGKFFRASNARRTRPDGTGVGLFLAKKVVTDHRGEIIFESKEGKGSTFGFRLPLK